MADLSVKPLMQASLGLHLSAGVRYFIDNVYLFLHREGSLTLVRRERRVGQDLNTALILKSLPF